MMTRLRNFRSFSARTKRTAAAIVALAALGWGSSASAGVTTLTFDPAPPTCGATACDNGSAISQTYGDSATADVTYTSVNLTPGSPDGPFLQHWWQDYGDLLGVVYGSPGAGTISQILFRPAAGYTLALIGFDAGCFYNRPSCQTIDYTFARGDGMLLGSGSASVPLNGHASVAINSGYFADGIRLRWGPDSYNGGLDNIRFDVRAIGIGGVPEPTIWAMMILGFGIIGAALRRRKPVLTPQRLLTA